MKSVKKIQNIGESPLVSMGNIRLRQPLPNKGISSVDPFLLLHHYGPYAISPFNNPFDLGAHPHRGFEPITFLFKGEQLHRDSLGNESIVKVGDVQWTTAGRGIIHAEGPTKEFIEKTGELEGIQLWLNLPSCKKMIPANYQHITEQQMPKVVSEDKQITLKIVAGKLQNNVGAIVTQTEVNVFIGNASENGEMTFHIPENHTGLLYLLDGDMEVNGANRLEKNKNQMITFSNEGTTITISSSQKSTFLFLSGIPLEEKVVQQGPFVMNTETEILEAMRDYKMGKMGYLY